MPRDRATDLAGWNLVDEAQRLVGAHFSTYSVLHPWESPEVAFRRGRRFCTQYNGALGIIPLELAGLRHEDIDLDYARVSPVVPRVAVDGKVQESATKTSRGER